MKYSRRKFIKSGAYSVAAASLPWSVLQAATPKNVGLQLYTLREVIEKDPVGVIKKVAEMGYTVLEGYGNKNGQYFGIPPTELATLLKQLKVRMVSTHAVSARKQDEKNGSTLQAWEQLKADALTVGCEYVVCPWMDASEYETMDDIKKLAEYFNKKGESAAQSGLKFAYHNHAFEFDTVIEGKCLYDHLLALCDPKLVSFELDLFWIQKAEKSAVEYFNAYPGRFPLWHVKDMDKTDRNLNTEIGSGQIDFKKIFPLAQKAGLKYAFVEQETYKIDPMESVKISFEYMKKEKLY